jgi:hypothetical protein
MLNQIGSVSKEIFMRRSVFLLALLTLFVLNPVAHSHDESQPSVVWSVMADGIGDLTFASPEWVEEARNVLTDAVARQSHNLKDLGTFTLCEVAHNPPAYLHVEGALAWYAKFDGDTVEVGSGELPASECDLKIQGDHSIISNLARIQYHGNHPEVVAAAQAQLRKLSKWKIDGKMTEHKALRSVLRSFHDAMAGPTMPRFIWMSPDWVEIARRIVCDRARMSVYDDGLRDVDYLFSEYFTDGPKYAFPNGEPGGFWVKVSYGEVTVGSGVLPKDMEPADHLSFGLYDPIINVGRTVNPAMNEADLASQNKYREAAFAPDPNAKKPIHSGALHPSERGNIPAGMGLVMRVLHDELSKRTSGELPSDYYDYVPEKWGTPMAFDRSDSYDSSWVLYDQFNIYGEPVEKGTD